MITQQRLHELFEYRDDGNLIRKTSINSRAQKGYKLGASFVKKRCYVVKIDGNAYSLHRVIFMYHHGSIDDTKQIEHIDGDTTNNRIENLRYITRLTAKDALTQQRLHELFEYRDDGNLIWKNNKGTSKKGSAAGCVEEHGYIRINVDRKRYRLHQLIFFYHHGYLTDGKYIDHIDGNPSNNRIENLREVTASQNLMNSKLSAGSTSGVKGVHWYKSKNKYQVHVTLNSKTIHLGYFDTIEEAEAAAIAGREKYHGDFARHN